MTSLPLWRPQSLPSAHPSLPQRLARAAALPVLLLGLVGAALGYTTLLLVGLPALLSLFG